MWICTYKDKSGLTYTGTFKEIRNGSVYSLCEHGILPDFVLGEPGHCLQHNQRCIKLVTDANCTWYDRPNSTTKGIIESITTGIATNASSLATTAVNYITESISNNASGAATSTYMPSVNNSTFNNSTDVSPVSEGVSMPLLFALSATASGILFCLGACCIKSRCAKKSDYRSVESVEDTVLDPQGIEDNMEESIEESQLRLMEVYTTSDEGKNILNRICSKVRAMEEASSIRREMPESHDSGNFPKNLALDSSRQSLSHSMNSMQILKQNIETIDNVMQVLEQPERVASNNSLSSSKSEKASPNQQDKSDSTRICCF